jgi:hypothetical protein
VKNPDLIDVVFAEVGHQIPRPEPCLRQRPEGAGLILSFSDRGHTMRRHALNRMSREVYELCDGERRLEDIRGLLLERYRQLPAPVVSEHVLRAIRVFERKGIVRCS